MIQSNPSSLRTIQRKGWIQSSPLEICQGFLSPLGPKDISWSATVSGILNTLSPSSWSLKNRKQSWECLEVFLTLQASWACRDIDICCIFVKTFSSNGKYSFSLFLHSHFLFLSIKKFPKLHGLLSEYTFLFPQSTEDLFLYPPTPQNRSCPLAWKIGYHNICLQIDLLNSIGNLLPVINVALCNAPRIMIIAQKQH